jgi:hypothetical protein
MDGGDTTTTPSAELREMSPRKLTRRSAHFYSTIIYLSRATIYSNTKERFTSCMGIEKWRMPTRYTRRESVADSG